MEIYNDYLNLIKEAVDSDPLYQKERRSEFHTPRSPEKLYQLRSRYSNKEIAPSLAKLAGKLNRDIDFSQQLGLHPSFKHLKATNNTEEHYIVSAFIDIKGSTNLFRRFDKETIHLIVEAILKAGIHTALIFGGYVHRLQGDGLFLYYGGKNINKSEAVLQSLKMVSVYSHFIQNDLKEYFRENGIEGISVRSGIDLGDSPDVLWVNSGMGNISEVTTCSLHTSLASKMQGNANSNGVVVGDNIIKELDFEDLFTPVCHRTNDEKDRYIFEIPEKRFRYTQYDFNWTKFLKLQDFIALDRLGNVVLKKQDYSSESAEYLKPIAETNKPYFGYEK